MTDWRAVCRHLENDCEALRGRIAILEEDIIEKQKRLDWLTPAAKRITDLEQQLERAQDALDNMLDQDAQRLTLEDGAHMPGWARREIVKLTGELSRNNGVQGPDPEASDFSEHYAFTSHEVATGDTDGISDDWVPFGYVERLKAELARANETIRDLNFKLDEARKDLHRFSTAARKLREVADWSESAKVWSTGSPNRSQSDKGESDVENR